MILRIGVAARFSTLIVAVVATTLISGCAKQRSSWPLISAEKPAPAAEIDNSDESHWTESFKNFVRRKSDRDLELTAKELTHQAEYFADDKQYAQALAVLKKLLNMQLSRYGPEHPRIATTYCRLAELYHCLGDFKTEEMYERKDLAIKQKFLGLAAPDVLSSFNTLCGNLLSRGKYKEVGKMVDGYSAQIEQLTAKRADVNVRLNLVTSLLYGSLGNQYDSAGQHAEALQAWLRLIPLYQRRFGPYSREVGSILENAANDYYLEKNFTDALAMRQQAIAIYERKDLVPDVMRVGGAIAQSYLDRGFEYDRKGMHAQGLEIWLQLLPVYQRLHGADSVEVAAVCEDIGNDADAQNDFEVANGARKRALAIYQKHGRSADAARMRKLASRGQ